MAYSKHLDVKECEPDYVSLGKVLSSRFSIRLFISQTYTNEQLFEQTCKFVNNYFLSIKFIHAHLQYVCNISVNY